MTRQNAIGQQETEQAVFSSVDDLARHIGLSRHNTYRGLADGAIPSIRLGKRFIIPKAAISEWLKTAGGNVAA
jgi:excisionase family DNA binding protein